MITFFTTGKPFTGRNGVSQRNALASWKRVAPDAEVILFGDEEGAAETARELGIRHVAEVETVAQASDNLNAGFASTNPKPRDNAGFVSTNPAPPKLLRSFFDAAQRMARHEIVCYANCDIVLMEDFAAAVDRVALLYGGLQVEPGRLSSGLQVEPGRLSSGLQVEPAPGENFLMVGRRWDTDVPEPIAFGDSDWKEKLRERARRQGKQSSGDWIDYFAFRRGFYLGKMPELVIGRVYWDQWLVWKAREMGAVVVDASEAVMAIHQNHDYGYHPAGKAGVWTDALAQRNYALAGGRWHLRTIDDATHVLGPAGLRENPARRKRAAARVLRTAKDAAWVTAMDWTRPLRSAIGLRKNPPSENSAK